MVKHLKTNVFSIWMKLGMLFVNSGQFNQENFEFINFPDFCGYATTVLLHLKISSLDSPLNVTICLKIFHKETYFCQVLFLEISL